MKARGLNSGHAVRPRLEQGNDEANRDSQRRKFGTLLGEQMRQSPTTTFTLLRSFSSLQLTGDFCLRADLIDSKKAHKFTMHWGPAFLKFAYRGQFRITNYPAALVNIGQIIGERYETKKIGMAQYNDFMPAFEVANGLRAESADIDATTAVTIESWSTGSCCQLEDFVFIFTNRTMWQRRRSVLLRSKVIFRSLSMLVAAL